MSIGSILREIDLRKEWNSLPNLISYGRVALIVPVWLLALRPGPAGWIGLTLVVIGMLSDKLDGYLAKKDGSRLSTNLGKLIDPIADKLFILAAMTVTIFRQDPSLKLWITVSLGCIAFREVIVMFVKSRRPIKSAVEAGRFSMTAQCITVAVLFLPLGIFPGQTEAIKFLLSFAVGASLCSGWVYLSTENVSSSRVA